MSSRVLGSGAYGTVRLDPTDPTKCIKTLFPKYPKQYQVDNRQAVLDRIDPPDPKNNKRKYFGGKITDKTVKGTPNPSIKQITKFKMVLQGESLEKIIKKAIPATRDKLKMAFLNLLDGLCVLSQHKYSHNDIKEENVTYDDATGALRFIDPDLFLTEFKTTPPGFFYFAYAPELWPSSRNDSINITRFNNDMKAGGFFTPHDANEFERLMGSRDLASLILKPPVHWWIKELLEFLRNKPYYNDIDYSKTDVYSLALLAAKLFYRYYPELRPIIDCMIQPDPSKRCTAEQARRRWKNATRKVSFGLDIVHEPPRGADDLPEIQQPPPRGAPALNPTSKDPSQPPPRGADDLHQIGKKSPRGAQDPTSIDPISPISPISPIYSTMILFIL